MARVSCGANMGLDGNFFLYRQKLLAQHVCLCFVLRAFHESPAI